ncbi:hypothetical protein [Streptomyces sp. NPDC051994]|uniref:hypothetical protein n=1 Tax=unclassified Streptomyces TaxID=2593676 RepID=UPI00342FF7F6
MTASRMNPERAPGTGPGGPESAQDPQPGTERGGGGRIKAQRGAQGLDPDEQAFLDLHAPREEAHFDCPGYHSGLAADGGCWPATRPAAYHHWPETITDLDLPEETL